MYGPDVRACIQVAGNSPQDDRSATHFAFMEWVIMLLLCYYYGVGDYVIIMLLLCYYYGVGDYVIIGSSDHYLRLIGRYNLPITSC